MTIRLRLTLLYGGLLLAAGIVLLTITYLFVARSPWPGEPPRPDVPDLGGIGPPPSPETPVLDGWIEDQRSAQRDEDLRQLLTGSGVALTVLAVAAASIGWLMAGRVLRPLATMTDTVRAIEADDIDRRLTTPAGPAGPDDELKRLADTFDGLLDRRAAALRSQQQFVAHVSHELRTPLTLQRTLVEVALADPGADADTLRAACGHVLSGVEEQERIIEALLVLARSQRGPTARQPVDLTATVRRLVDDRLAAAEERGLRLTTDLVPTTVVGDPDLLERLVANLLDNALAHNVGDGDGEGWTHVAVRPHAFRIANSGPAVAPAQIPHLVEPFHRSRTRSETRGLGLGLSIVAAIAHSHSAHLALTPHPPPTGGLTVTVDLGATSSNRWLA